MKDNSSAKRWMSDNVKDVDVKQCIITIILALVAFCITFIPYTFGSLGTNLSISYMPLFGDGSILVTHEFIQQGVAAILNLEGEMLSFVLFLINYDTLFFLIIILADVVLAVVHLILGNSLLRIIFHITSIVFGVILILVLISNLLFIVGLVGCFTHAIVGLDNVLAAIEPIGIFFVLGSIVACAILIKRQFVWFETIFK